MNNNEKWERRAIPESWDENDSLTCYLKLEGLVTELPVVKELAESRRNIRIMFNDGGIDTNKVYPEVYNQAVDIVIDAIQNKRRIVISGDYDVDGMTATAALYTCIRHVGGDVDWAIPSREHDGYGMNYAKISSKCKEHSLIISVDNGIACNDVIAKLYADGHTVLVTDHHLAEGKILPTCECILDPKVFMKPEDDEYMASGCYLSAKLGNLIYQKMIGRFNPDLMNYLDAVVGLSIISDMIDLNPTMMYQLRCGLAALGNTSHAGLRALLSMSGYRDGINLNSTFIGMMVSPKLNAAGRMDNVDAGMQILLKETDTSSGNVDSMILANSLKALNTSRKLIEVQIVTEAYNQIEEYVGTDIQKIPAGLVAYGPEWKSGVLGIVAARLVDIFRVPVIVLSGTGDSIHGSGRSPEGGDLYGAMNDCADILTQFGGHKAAGGCSLLRKDLDAFRAKFAKVLEEKDRQENVRYYDGKVTIPNLHDLRFQQFMYGVEPTGKGNEPVSLLLADVWVVNVNKARDTTYISVVDRNTNTNIVVSKYRCSEEWTAANLISTNIDVLISPNVTYWNGVTSPEYKIISLKAHE